MRTKNLGFQTFNRSIIFLSFLSFAVLAQPTVVEAQKLPIAMKKNSRLSATNKDDYDAAATAYKNISNVQNRNKLIYLAVAQIDLNFGNFQKNKRKRNEFFQILLDMLEIGASTAISITKGERAKTLIAESLGFVQSSRSSINKNLRLLEIQILFNKMVSKRAEIYKGIALKSALPTSIYPFEMAFVDIVAYYQAGTIDGALTNLATDTGAEANDATREIPTLTIATKKDVENAVIFDDYVAKLVEDAQRGDINSLKKIKDGLKNFIKSDLDSYGVLPSDAAKIDGLNVNEAIELLGDLRAVLSVNNSANISKLLEFLK